MGTIYYGDAEVLEESFSFNCNDDFSNFSHNPMAVLVLDDEDDDESYIEIAIAPASTTDEDEDEDDEEEEAMEFQFRISFTSAPSFPPLLSSQCSKNSPDTDSFSSSTSNLFSSSSSTSTTASMSSEWDGASQKLNPPVPSNVRKTFVSSLKESWEIGDTKDRLCESPQSAIHSSKTTNWGLIQSRKTSKVITAINYGIMKFFVKFRSVKLQSMLSSVKKSQKVAVPQGNIIRHSTGTCQRDQKQRSNIKNYFGIGDRSRVAEINLDAFKGIIDATGVMSIGRRKDRQPKRKSCPSSVKSSPIHQGSVSSEGCQIYTREHSIQAAIAHCKRSSGATSESCAQGFPKA